jgi:hypothetical protein
MEESLGDRGAESRYTEGGTSEAGEGIRYRDQNGNAELSWHATKKGSSYA